MKRKISLIAAFLLAFTFAFPADSVYADTAENSSSETESSEETVYETEDGLFSFRLLEDGTAELYDYLMKDSTNDVIIPAMININDNIVLVTSISDYAFFQSQTGYVIMPDSITSIGEGAFLQCPRLKDFVVPDSVKTIGEGALGILHDEESDTFYTNEDFKLYGYAEKLTSDYAELFGFKYADASSLIRYSEYNGEMTLESADKRIHYAVIPESIDGKPVTRIGAGLGGFTDCRYLVEVTLPDSVKKIGSLAFSGTALEEITIPSGVTEIDFGAFKGCNYLDKINIPEGVTRIEKETFKDCWFLEDPGLSDNITYIGDHAFNGCESLKSFEIPSSVQSLGNYVFANCTELESIKVSPDNKNFYDEDGVLFKRTEWANGNITKDLVKYPANRSGEEYTVPEGIQNISEDAFGDCQNLKRVKISDGTEQLKIYAFSDSEVLESVTVPESLWIIDRNFDNCPNLTVYSAETKAMKEFEDKWKNEIPLKIVYVKPEETKNDIISGDPGDINDDGSITTADIIVLLRYLLSAEDKINKDNSDLNSDGAVNVMDYILLKNMFLK